MNVANIAHYGFRLVLDHSGRSHFQPPRVLGSGFGVAHGPATWPWWRLFWLSVVTLGTPATRIKYGRRLWVYTRWWSWCGDIYLVRDE